MIQEVPGGNGARRVGNGPAYLLFCPDGSVWWFYENVPDPDNKSIYRKLNALDGYGRPKREVYEIASLMTEDPQEFSARTRTAWAQLKKFAESGDLDGMRAAQRIVKITIDYALSANRVLQPVADYLAVPDADLDPKAYAHACEESDKAAKKKLSAIDSLLQAARKFRLHESRGGTRQRNLDLTHAEFANDVLNLARQWKRVPFRAEIADETGETLKAIAVKLKAIGAAWIPAKGRGKDKITRKKLT